MGGFFKEDDVGRVALMWRLKFEDVAMAQRLIFCQ